MKDKLYIDQSDRQTELNGLIMELKRTPKPNKFTTNYLLKEIEKLSKKIIKDNQP